MDFLPETVRAVEANYFFFWGTFAVSFIIFYRAWTDLLVLCFQLDSARVVRHHTFCHLQPDVGESSFLGTLEVQLFADDVVLFASSDHDGLWFAARWNTQDKDQHFQIQSHCSLCKKCWIGPSRFQASWISGEREIDRQIGAESWREKNHYQVTHTVIEDSTTRCLGQLRHPQSTEEQTGDTSSVTSF